jgi:hypothetical protein
MPVRRRPKKKGGRWYGAQPHAEEMAMRALAEERAAHADTVARFRRATQARRRAKEAARARAPHTRRDARREMAKAQRTVGHLRRSLDALRSDFEVGTAALMQVSCLLFTVTFYANRAHNLTRSPNIFDDSSR